MSDSLTRPLRLFWAHARESRLLPLYLSLALYVAASMATRLILLTLHADQWRDAWLGVPAVLVRGFALDVFIGACLAIPFTLFLLLMPTRWLAARGVRVAVHIVFVVHIFALLYLCVAEIVFFEEFNSRINYIAFDYLIYPREVFVNIRETYPIGKVLLGDALASLLLYAGWGRAIDRALRRPLAVSIRWRAAAGWSAPIAAGVIGLNLSSLPASDNRVLNELASNGVYTFVQAGVINEVDYDDLYARLDEREVFTRLHQLMTTDNSRYVHPEDTTDVVRAVTGRGQPRPMNVVLVLGESFGSQFVGSLHPEGPALTPEFDALARDGLFFTHIYATGNRTVRGLEASLASIPPLPGRSLVKRPGGVGVFSLPSVFKGKGYQTAFIYGGRSYFDNIRDFALGNQFERVVDQDDFRKITFTTVWGVADEDLFDNTLTELDAMHATGQPFFTTVLTVSNHTPYTYPAGRIAENPAEQKREHAIKYADYAIGKFMRDARSHTFFEHTLFVFLGDHGARVYGHQEIPLQSYEIPVLFYAPTLIAQGQRNDLLGSQMDLAPTLLGLLDMDYQSQFFGRDLRHVPPDRAWALMTHNRDVALMRGEHVAVLGIRNSQELWRCDPKTGEFTRLPNSADPELLADAIAYYQGANRLYHLRRLKPQPQAPVTAQRAAARPG